MRANRFWVGANRDPANTSTGGNWRGIAHYIPANSPIDEPFFWTVYVALSQEWLEFRTSSISST